MLSCSVQLACPTPVNRPFPIFMKLENCGQAFFLEQRSSALLISEANCLPDTGAFAPNSTGGRLPQENN